MEDLKIIKLDTDTNVVTFIRTYEIYPKILKAIVRIDKKDSRLYFLFNGRKHYIADFPVASIGNGRKSRLGA